MSTGLLLTTLAVAATAASCSPSAGNGPGDPSPTLAPTHTVRAPAAQRTVQDDGFQITLYSDDQAAGAEECRQRLAEYPAGTSCHVEPEDAAPDLAKPGWADTSGPLWDTP